MRVLLVSDIHANLAALEAVIGDADSGGAIDAVWSIGDCVGYGPQPGECIARLRGMQAAMVAGNHERAATGAMSTEDFNPDAAASAEWTNGVLSAEEREFLDSLPEVTRPAEEFTIVHGSLRDPVWEYLLSYDAALGHLELQQTPFSVVGHTHLPMVVVEDERLPQGCELYRAAACEVTPLEENKRLIINPGSVGQPRDGDPRAAYAIWDSEARTVTMHRVAYDIQATQKLMAEAELPRWLIERLSTGR